MLKNITLSAEESLIEKARRRAEAENTTLNAEFRNWLTQYIQRSSDVPEFITLMDHLKYVQSGKTYTRDELNER
jgi:hypothetical protein